MVDEEHVAPRRTRRARSGSGWDDQHAPPAAEEDEAADDAEPEDAEQDNRRRGAAGEPVARPGERRGTAAPAAGRGERRTQDDSRPAVSAAVAARRAVEIVVEFTGREAENVVAIDRRDGDWYVDVEVVETHRIPDTTDVLAIYEVRLDPGGQLLSYRRTRRYARGQLDRETR
ncbi:hypothetical protein GCM10009609_63720 [Pseudonocardia aurantiaca]|uniref:Gas vesicle protein GvpO n=1 Tax=Pseudonocardia aurantiaca TaxID=75290 RepID=A0ABW4FTI2_9PSEU